MEALAMWLMYMCVKISHAIFPFSVSHLHHMAQGNQTKVSEFLLLGFSEDPELQPLIFWLFLSMYLITVFGNLLIILATISDSHLHTPMYFFLSNLSFVDIGFTSTTIPKMLWNIQTQSKVITYEGCIIQIFFFFVTFSNLNSCILGERCCRQRLLAGLMGPFFLVLNSWQTDCCRSDSKNSRWD